MSASLLLVVFAIGQSQSANAVTDAEKKDFVKLLATLPTRGEFFAEDAIQKAAPYTRVLLALTEKDLDNRDPYPFVALSVGLMGHKEAREYAAANFGKIAHPQIKLGWAIMLFRHGTAPPEVLPYLRKAVVTEPEGNFGLGPGFEDFKDNVIRASEAGRLMKLQSVSQHVIQAFPEFGGGQDYRNRDYIFAPGELIHAVRPHRKQQRGELITYDLAKGKASSRLIPQPAGFKAEFDFASYFESADLAVNADGDLLCTWMIKGNGDHGFALFTRGAADFQVSRVAEYLMGSRVVPATDGSWCFVQDGSGFFVIHRLEKSLKLSEIGKIRRHEQSGISDAQFISKGVLHLLASGEGLGLHCIDFDVKERKILHNREILRPEKLGVPEQATVVQASDGSLHYIWGIWDRRDVTDPKEKKRESLDGLYYQAEANTARIKVGGGYHHRAIAVGDRIVICYTQESAPNMIYFRVIRHGTLGPVTELAIAKDREHPLWTEDMVLHAEAERIWFVNTLAPNTLHEFKLVDTPRS
jgi:hypothetical protein